MKETYKVKTPKKIVFGDPYYFEEFTGEKLERLTVDYSPPSRFAARVVLEEEPYEEYPDLMQRSMIIYLAPNEIIDTYLKGMMYASQKESVKDIGVDTARYYLEIDEADDTISTGGDGYWGDHREYTRDIAGRTILDATVTTIAMSEFETMDSMREYLKYFFDEVEQIENVEPPEEEPVQEDDSQEMNM